MKLTLIILTAITIFSSGILLGGTIVRVIYFNGYAELTDKWQETCGDIQEKCDENTKKLIEQADENCKRLLGI